MCIYAEARDMGSSTEAKGTESSGDEVADGCKSHVRVLGTKLKSPCSCLKHFVNSHLLSP